MDLYNLNIERNLGKNLRIIFVALQILFGSVMTIKQILNFVENIKVKIYDNFLNNFK